MLKFRSLSIVFNIFSGEKAAMILNKMVMKSKCGINISGEI